MHALCMRHGASYQVSVPTQPRIAQSSPPSVWSPGSPGCQRRYDELQPDRHASQWFAAPSVVTVWYSPSQRQSRWLL